MFAWPLRQCNKQANSNNKKQLVSCWRRMKFSLIFPVRKKPTTWIQNMYVAEHHFLTTFSDSTDGHTIKAGREGIFFFTLETLANEISIFHLSHLDKGSHFVISSEKLRSLKKRKKKGKFFLQASCCGWKMNRSTGLTRLIGQNKAQPRVSGTCFVLSEAPRPLGTNCAAQRVLLPGGLSWSTLDYNSQLLL